MPSSLRSAKLPLSDVIMTSSIQAKEADILGGKEEYLQKINFETEQKLAEMNNRVQQKEQLVINDLVAQVSHRPL